MAGYDDRGLDIMKTEDVGAFGLAIWLILVVCIDCQGETGGWDLYQGASKPLVMAFTVLDES